MNYYPFHIGDYLSATRHLSWEEDAAYRRLLDTYYITEKPLPSELRAVCRLVLATTESQREAVKTILDEFFELTADGWINRRADDEIIAMRDKQQKQRDRANKRWHKPDDGAGNATAMPRHPSGNPGNGGESREPDETTDTNATASATAMPRHAQADATASKADANAMPPTPTPTPTPTPIEERNTGASAKRAKPAVLVKPDGIADSVWADFQAIRKAKRAPLTATALDGIEREAAKAGMTLADVLALCCTRGWQGFKAEWVSQPAAGAPARPTKFDPVAYVNSRKEAAHVVIDVAAQRVA
jgi:uncharacterized protein YdaU (DUF1376 family)